MNDIERAIGRHPRGSTERSRASSERARESSERARGSIERSRASSERAHGSTGPVRAPIELWRAPNERARRSSPNEGAEPSLRTFAPPPLRKPRADPQPATWRRTEPSNARPGSVARPQPSDAAPSRPVCHLPIAELEAAGYLTPQTPKNALTEQYRRIKRPLLRNLDGAPAANASGEAGANVIMVTSSVEGEGKTYTAINLAISLALERDRTVLLVDADVIKGSASRRLGLDEDAFGLIELLLDDDLDAGDVITPTDVPDLRVLPAGASDERATELLSSGAMSALMAELSTRYPDRIIVLDCPPMLAATEASAIASHVGQVVFVVAEGDTAQHDVDEALGRFDTERYVGVLMNKVRGGVNKAYKYGYA